MAAFEQHQSGPDLDLFQGRSWEDWQKAVDAESSNTSENSRSSKQSKEVARLKRQDFGLFGFVPAKDDFYVVVCKHCHLPVKPQAFSYHIEKYHKEKSKTKASQKPPDPGGRSTLFSTLTALSCNNVARQSLTPDHLGCANSTELSCQKPSSQPFQVHPAQKKVLQDGTSSSPNSKKRVSTQDLTKTSKSPSKVKQLRLDKEPSPLARKHLSKSKIAAPKKSMLDQNQSSNLIVKSKSSSSFHAKESLPLPVSTTIATVTSLSLPIKSDPKIILNNVPVVVLEKPINIDKPISLPHSQKRDSTNSRDSFSHHIPKSSSMPSTSYRQYTHNYNPQFDIVKSPDRGVDQSQLPTVNCEDVQNQQTVKPKKISATLKVRDYDPNKHCGVWLPEENTNCTRSFTCKFHAKGIKRQVPGRLKPFDIMLKEHLRGRNKMKEKSDPADSKKAISPRVPEGPTTSSPGPGTLQTPSMQQQASASKALPMQPPNSSKVSSSTAPKTKPSLQLFPRSASVSVVDLWHDPMVQYDDKSKAFNQCYANRHPSPLMVCHFGARKIGVNHVAYNHASDFQWNVVSSMNKQVRKQNLVNLVDANQTTSHFTSIPPATAPVINMIKSEKDSLARQRSLSASARSSNCNTVSNYARTKLAPSLRRLNHQNQRFLSPNEALLRSNLKTSIAAATIPTRRNAIAPESVSASNSLFVPMPLDHRLSNDSRPSTSRHGSDVAFSSDVNLGLVLQPNSSAFTADHNIPVYNQQCNSTLYKRESKVKTLPIKIKQEPVNGLSSTMLSARTTHQPPSSQPQTLEDYIFTDDSTNSKTIQLNQSDSAGRRGRFSQDVKPTNTSVSNTNALFDVDTTSDQLIEILSGNTPAAPSAPFRNWSDSSRTNSASSDKKRITQAPNAVSQAPNLSDNWTTELLTLLDPSDQGKNTAASSGQNFSYAIRDNNFLSFSNDSSNIAEISNT